MKVFCCFILGWQIPGHIIKGEDESEVSEGFKGIPSFGPLQCSRTRTEHQEHQVVKWRFQDLRMSGSRKQETIFKQKSSMNGLLNIQISRKDDGLEFFPNEGLHLEKKCLEIVPFDVWMVSTSFCRSGGRCHNVDKLSHRISMGKVKSKISEE